MSSDMKDIETVGDLLNVLKDYEADQELFLCGDIYGGAVVNVLVDNHWKEIWYVG